MTKKSGDMLLLGKTLGEALLEPTIIYVKPALAAIDAIGLFEGKLDALCDITVAITAPEEDRISRLLQRDGITPEHAALRIRAQKPESYFREKCDYILENNGTALDFQRKCFAFFENLSILKKD